MTSLLRRKHQITPLSTRRTSSSREQGAGSRELSSRLRLSALAVLAFAVSALNANAASELKWRGANGTTTSRSIQVSQPASNTSSGFSTSTSLDSSAGFASSGNPLRFKRPQSTPVHVDNAVRPVVFEDDAPQLVSGTGVDTNTRSVVVNRDEVDDSFRSAQLTGSAGSAATDTPSSTPPSDRLRSPFGDETPQLETPQFETPSRTDTPTDIPPPKDNLMNEPQRNPARNSDIPQPIAPSQRGQFQPVLPSGPTPPSEIETGPPAPLAPTPTFEADRDAAKESCDKSLENLRAYTVDKVKLNIDINGTEGKDFPFECSIDNGQEYQGRSWEQTTYMWKASALCHKPLYFEDEQLERYGHSFSPCFQPFVSGAHFFLTLPVLPYCMGVEPPCECIYALGHYRPGSCAPYMCNPIPLSPRGALFQAGAVTGAAAILP